MAPATFRNFPDASLLEALRNIQAGVAMVQEYYRRPASSENRLEKQLIESISNTLFEGSVIADNIYQWTD